jgi:hypothetical protein
MINVDMINGSRYSSFGERPKIIRMGEMNDASKQVFRFYPCGCGCIGSPRHSKRWHSVLPLRVRMYWKSETLEKMAFSFTPAGADVLTSGIGQTAKSKFYPCGCGCIG